MLAEPRACASFVLPFRVHQCAHGQQFYCGGIDAYDALVRSWAARATKDQRSSGSAGAAAADRGSSSAASTADCTGVQLRQTTLDVAVAMHACGQLTDLALDLCVATSARFVLCPCCYGQLVRGGAGTVVHARPRSVRLCNARVPYGFGRGCCRWLIYKVHSLC